MVTYLDYLDAMKILNNFLSFMFKRMPRNSISMSDYYAENFSILFHAKLVMLKNLPHLANPQSLRREFLNYMKQELSDITGLEKNDRG